MQYYTILLYYLRKLALLVLDAVRLVDYDVAPDELLERRFLRDRSLVSGDAYLLDALGVLGLLGVLDVGWAGCECNDKVGVGVGVVAPHQLLERTLLGNCSLVRRDAHL